MATFWLLSAALRLLYVVLCAKYGIQGAKNALDFVFGGLRRPRGRLRRSGASSTPTWTRAQCAPPLVWTLGWPLFTLFPIFFAPLISFDVIGSADHEYDLCFLKF